MRIRCYRSIFDLQNIKINIKINSYIYFETKKQYFLKILFYIKNFYFYKNLKKFIKFFYNISH